MKVHLGVFFGLTVKIKNAKMRSMIHIIISLDANEGFTLPNKGKSVLTKYLRMENAHLAPNHGLCVPNKTFLSFSATFHESTIIITLKALKGCSDNDNFYDQTCFYVKPTLWVSLWKVQGLT